jgi:hypothetical protein
MNTHKKRWWHLFKKYSTPHRSPEMGGGLVQISHKISSTSSKPQIIKIGDKYFRVKELG